jgi:hypothetical protein
MRRQKGPNKNRPWSRADRRELVQKLRRMRVPPDVPDVGERCTRCGFVNWVWSGLVDGKRVYLCNKCNALRHSK